MVAPALPLRAPQVPVVGPLLAAAFALLVVGVLAADMSRDDSEAVGVRAGAPASVAPAAGTGTLPVVDIVTAYRVQPGDSLSTIAALHDVALGDLASANGLTPPYALGAGQVLQVPAPDLTGAAPPPVADDPVAGAIERWAAEYDLSPALLKAVTWRESRWQADALSHRGAVGIGQVLPATAAWVSDTLVGERLDPWQVEDNLRLSAAYLRWLIDRAGGDQATALAAYHQGRTSVLGKGWYSVTERYVADVFELRWQFEAAAARSAQSA